MASISLQQLKIVEDQLRQIQEAIHNLELWNEPLTDVNELLSSPGGMKTLAADCILQRHYILLRASGLRASIMFFLLRRELRFRKTGHQPFRPFICGFYPQNVIPA